METLPVLITGASTGIGQVTAVHLASRGHRVFAGVRKEQDAAAIKTAGGANITPLILDVTRPEQVRDAVDSVRRELSGGMLGGLVNNAGISVVGPWEAVPMEQIRRQFEVNVFGAIAMTQALLPMLRESRGRVVNISSVAGVLASPGFGPYTASKFALEAFTHSLRRELRPHGVWACSVGPGVVKTPIWEKSTKEGLALEESFPTELRVLYKPLIETLKTFARGAEKNATDPLMVAKAVTHALTSKRPRTRYPVGVDGHAGAALTALLPSRAVDAVVARM